MNAATERIIIENRIFNLDGNCFQDLCDRLCLKLYPDDYTPVRAGGPKGDTKMDGYCPNKKIYFAAHATRGEKTAVVKKKIEDDFEGCLKLHNDIKKWIFLTNDTLLGDIETHVNNLRKMYKKIKIETWGHKKITEEIIKYDRKEISEIIGLDLEITIHLQSEIDNVTKLLKEKNPTKALNLLERLWEQYKTDMTGNEKYRTRANMGHAFIAQDKYKEAADCFLEAINYDPKNEKARAREALAYLLLGNTNKAQELASVLIKEFPEENLGWAVYIRSAPKDLKIEEIEKMIPSYQSQDTEVIMAIGEAAMQRGHYNIAEKHFKALKNENDLPQIKEVMGDLLLHKARISEQAINNRGPTKEEKEYLEKAKELYTESLKGYQEKNIISSITRMLLKRANAFRGLNDDRGEYNDISSAYFRASTEPDVVFNYAVIKAEESNWNEAISLLESLIGKGYRCGIELFLSRCLDKRNLEGDKQRAIDLLESRINDLIQEETEIRAEFIMLFVELKRQINGLEQAIKTIENLPKSIISEELFLVFKGELCRFSGNLESAKNIAKEVLLKININTTLHEKRRIATFIQAVGIYDEALKIWKSIVVPEYIGQDTYRIMECADKCEDVAFITEFTEKIRANGLWERKLFDLELFYREKYNDWRNCKSILLNYIEKPFDENYIPFARALLSHVAVVIGEPNLIETDLSHLPSPYDVNPDMGLMIVQSLRIGGEPLKAVEFAYELVRNNWDSIEAYKAMANFMIPMGPKPLELSRPITIEAGDAVFYEELGTGEKKWHIIEDSKYGVIDSGRNEFSIEHPYSIKMIGLKKGDTFLLRGNEIQERTAKILEVISKYYYRINNCIDDMEDKFQEKAHVFKINAFREDGQIDLEPFERLADIGHIQGKELLKIYKEKQLPIYFVASKKGRDIFTTLVHLIEEKDIEIQCRLGHPSEMEKAFQALDTIEEVVIDEMALGTLVVCDMIEFLSKIPQKIIISEGTLFHIENWEIMGIDSNNPGGILGKREGKLFFSKRSKKGIDEAKSKISKLIKYIRENCIIESGISLQNIDVPYINDIIKFAGQECSESMALASLNNRIFWTDDFVSSALFSSQLGGQRIWTQCIFDYSARHGFIESALYKELTLKLLAFRYWFTSITEEIVIASIEKSDWNIDSSPLKEVLAHFGDKRVNLDANLMIMISKLLKYCWGNDQLQLKATAITIRAITELSKRGNETALIQALWIWLQRILGLDIITLEKIRSVINDWLKGQRGGTIIIP